MTKKAFVLLLFLTSLNVCKAQWFLAPEINVGLSRFNPTYVDTDFKFNLQSRIMVSGGLGVGYYYT